MAHAAGRSAAPACSHTGVRTPTPRTFIVRKSARFLRFLSAKRWVGEGGWNLLRQPAPPPPPLRAREICTFCTKSARKGCEGLACVCVGHTQDPHNFFVRGARSPTSLLSLLPRVTRGNQPSPGPNAGWSLPTSPPPARAREVTDRPAPPPARARALNLRAKRAVGRPKDY